MHVRDEELMFEHVGWMGSEAERVSRVANLQQPRSTHSQLCKSTDLFLNIHIQVITKSGTAASVPSKHIHR